VTEKDFYFPEIKGRSSSRREGVGGESAYAETSPHDLVYFGKPSRKENGEIRFVLW